MRVRRHLQRLDKMASLSLSSLTQMSPFRKHLSKDVIFIQLGFFCGWLMQTLENCIIWVWHSFFYGRMSFLLFPLPLIQTWDWHCVVWACTPEWWNNDVMKNLSHAVYTSPIETSATLHENGRGGPSKAMEWCGPLSTGWDLPCLCHSDPKPLEQR